MDLEGFAGSTKALNDNVCFRVDAHSSVSMWKDPWVPYLLSFRPSPSPRKHTVTCSPAMFSSLLASSASWNHHLLRSNLRIIPFGRKKKCIGLKLWLMISCYSCLSKWLFDS